MADSDLNIILRLVDEASAGIKTVSNNIIKVGHDFENFSKSLKTVAREAGSLGTILALWGTAGVAPFALAISNSAKSIDSVGEAMQKLGDITQVFQESLAKSVLPVIDSFTRSLNGMLHAFLSLPQPLRDAIAQGILFVSIYSLLSGIFIKIGAEILKVIVDITGLIGKFFILISTLATTNPLLLATYGALVIIVALMVKFKIVCDTVVSTFEFLVRALWTGLLTLQLAFVTALKAIADQVEKLVTLLAKIPGPSQKAFQGMIGPINELRRTLQDWANKDMTGIQVQSKKMADIIVTGQGDWSRAVDNTKNHIQNFFNAWKNGSDQAVQSAKTVRNGIDGIIAASNQFSSALTSLSGQNSKFAEEAKAISLAMAVINTAQAVTKAYAEYPWPFNMVVAGIMAAAGAIQVATIASQKFDVGTPNVPSDMVAQVHKGETIIPATFADAIRRGDLSLSGGGQGGGRGDVNVNIYYPKMTTMQEAKHIAETVGFEIERQLRYVNG